jgi:hypothetical protein
MAFDRLRIGRPPEEVERELIATGVDPEEAREVVGLGARRLYQRDRGVAMSNLLTGLFALVIGGALTAWSIIASQGGGLVVLFYGAVGYGLIEVARAWRRWPRPPASPRNVR